MGEGTAQRRRAIRILLGALRRPETLSALSAEDWDLLVRVARRTRLLGRLAADVEESGLLGSVPARVATHLRSAGNLVSHRHTQLTWELNRVLWAVRGLDAPVVALKGIAYTIAKLPPSRGRFFVDVDLLVPRESLTQVEQRLLARGWYKTEMRAYDEHYYRAWMHELPPLRHREREVEIDIHHSILPRTSRLRFDPALLFGDLRPVPESQVQVLSSPDMLLHALVHLFLEGDPREGLRLRDLLDAAELIRHFGRDPGFWELLPLRAERLGLGRPLFYGLRYAERLLGVEIPPQVQRSASRYAPGFAARSLMDWLVPLAICPDHPDYPGRRTAMARWILYARAHWLRMPPRLLARHLGYKLLLRAAPDRQDVGFGAAESKKL